MGQMALISSLEFHSWISSQKRQSGTGRVFTSWWCVSHQRTWYLPVDMEVAGVSSQDTLTMNHRGDEFSDRGIHNAEEAIAGSEDSCMQGCEESGN